MTVSVFVLLFLCLGPFAVSEECSLNYTEKFSIECSLLDISYPSVIFQDQQFLVSIHDEDNISISNVSLFTASDSYCGPNTFSQGHQCVIDLLGSSNATVTCLEGSSFIIGPISLVIGLSNCAVHLNVTWGQSELSILTYPIPHWFHYSNYTISYTEWTCCCYN